MITCEWREDMDGNWSTGCGEMFSFTYGPPSENRFRFCPYCGDAMDEHGYVEPPDDDEQQQEHDQ